MPPQVLAPKSSQGLRFRPFASIEPHADRRVAISIAASKRRSAWCPVSGPAGVCALRGADIGIAISHRRPKRPMVEARRLVRKLRPHALQTRELFARVDDRTWPT